MAFADTQKLIVDLSLKGNFASSLKSSERSLASFDQAVGRTEGRAFKAGQQIGTGIKRIAAASVALGVVGAGVFAKALSAASDLNETVSKVGVVFGKNAQQVLAFGKNSAEAMGLSQNAALAAAGTIGNLFVSLGLASNKAATMSTAMVKLAGDLASFNNSSPEEALIAIQAGLVGETEPLRKFGINLNDATLRQEALRLKLVKTTKEVLPPAIKAQAAYSLILKQSGTAQGDFARTSDGLANQIRILKANFTDMLATLAAPALPKVAGIFKTINKEIKANQPAIAELGKSIAGLFSDANIKAGTEFLKGAFETAKETAPVIAASAKATFGLVQGAVSLFKSLPPEIQKLAIGAFAVNKLTGGLVTNIAGGIIETVGKQFLQRGGTPANPLFVMDVTGGLGKGLPVAAGAAGAAASAALPLAVIAASIAGPIVAQQKISSDQQIIAYNLVTTNVAKQINGGASLADLQQSLAAVDKGINDIQSNPLNMIVGGQALEELKGNRTELQRAIDAIKLAGRDTVGGIDRLASNMTGKQRDDVLNLAQLQRGASAFIEDIRRMIRSAEADLRSLRPKNVKSDIEKLRQIIIGQGKGGVGAAASALGALKAALSNTHDPKTASLLRAAIHDMTRKLDYRTTLRAQLARADRILNSSRSTTQKIQQLQAIQKSISAKDLNAQHAIQVKIDAAKRAQVYAARATTEAVKDKDLSVSIKNVIPLSVSVSSRELTTKLAIQNRYYKVPT